MEKREAVGGHVASLGPESVWLWRPSGVTARLVAVGDSDLPSTVSEALVLVLVSRVVVEEAVL